MEFSRGTPLSSVAKLQSVAHCWPSRIKERSVPASLFMVEQLVNGSASACQHIWSSIILMAGPLGTGSAPTPLS